MTKVTQPIITDTFGVMRFAKNELVAGVFNERSRGSLYDLRKLGYSAKEILQLAQLIGMPLLEYEKLSESLKVPNHVDTETPEHQAQTLYDWIDNHPTRNYQQWVPVVMQCEGGCKPCMVRCSSDYNWRAKMSHLYLVEQAFQDDPQRLKGAVDESVSTWNREWNTDLDWSVALEFTHSSINNNVRNRN